MIYSRHPVRSSNLKSMGLRRYANGNLPEPYKNPVVSTSTQTLEGPVRVDYR